MKPARFGSIIAAILLSAAAGTAAAQQPAAPLPTRIGYVDTLRVMRDSRTSQKVQKTLEAEFQKRDREITGGPKDQIERRRLALADDMNLRREDELKHFIEKANGIIRRIAEAEKLDAVFQEASYAAARIDMTDKVIKELDAGR